MKIDKNKGITGIEYNHLNLPTRVIFNNNDPEYNSNAEYIKYLYDATGVKQEKQVKVLNLSSASKTFYAGNFIYEQANDQAPVTLKFFSHPEGYIEPTVLSGKGGLFLSKADYVYQFKDHLGNIRLSYSDSDGNGDIDAATEIIEENNYYPFGLKHKGYNNVVSANSNSAASKYKYNGKEFNDELGLNMYDYGARMYDPSVGKWFSVDAMAEKYYDQSTYTYTLNNPILYIDPDGNQVALCCWDEFVGIVKGAATLAYDNTIGLLEPIPIPEAGSIDVLSSLGMVTKEEAKTETKTLVETIKSGDSEKITLALGGLALSMKPGKKGNKTYQTYTKKAKDPSVDGDYSGRTSGTGTAAENIANRDKNHHKNDTHGPATLDKSSTNKDAIRGREQQNIEANGGAQSQRGTSGNAINGISDKNKKKQQYINAANEEFK